MISRVGHDSRRGRGTEKNKRRKTRSAKKRRSYTRLLFLRRIPQRCTRVCRAAVVAYASISMSSDIFQNFFFLSITVNYVYFQFALYLFTTMKTATNGRVAAAAATKTRVTKKKNQVEKIKRNRPRSGSGGGREGRGGMQKNQQDLRELLCELQFNSRCSRYPVAGQENFSDAEIRRILFHRSTATNTAEQSRRVKARDRTERGIWRVS